MAKNAEEASKTLDEYFAQTHAMPSNELAILPDVAINGGKIQGRSTGAFSYHWHLSRHWRVEGEGVGGLVV